MTHQVGETLCSQLSHSKKRDCTEQPPASGHKGRYLSAAGVEGTSLWCKCKCPWYPADPQLGALPHSKDIIQTHGPGVPVPKPAGFLQGVYVHRGSSRLQANGQDNLRSQQEGNVFEVHQTQLQLLLSCKARFPRVSVLIPWVHHRSTSCLPGAQLEPSWVLPPWTSVPAFCSLLLYFSGLSDSVCFIKV